MPLMNQQRKFPGIVRQADQPRGGFGRAVPGASIESMATKPTTKKSRANQHTMTQIIAGEFDGAPLTVRLRFIKQLQQHRAICLAAIRRLAADE
jgi:hypothetical protein